MNFVGTIANDSGSTGTVNVSGGGTNWNNSGTLTVGLSGVGTLNITGGAVVSSTSGFVSSFGTSVGSVAVVDGAGSRWEMTTGGVEVGSSSGSSGLLSITNGGTVTNAADMTIANLAGSNGAVNRIPRHRRWQSSCWERRNSAARKRILAASHQLFDFATISTCLVGKIH